MQMNRVYSGSMFPRVESRRDIPDKDYSVDNLQVYWCQWFRFPTETAIFLQLVYIYVYVRNN
jgi:hypothetical protein